MTPDIAYRAIAEFTQQIRSRLAGPSKAAQAAEACVEAGYPNKP